MNRTANHPNEQRKNNQNNQLKQFKCNVCYMQKGVYMVDCGCFYCPDCYLDSYSANLEEQICIICSKAMGQSFDIRDKADLRKIEQNLTDPAHLLNKVIHAIKFQELHNKKYIAELERKLANMQLENKELKAQCQMYQNQQQDRRQNKQHNEPQHQEQIDHGQNDSVLVRPAIDDQSLISAQITPGPVNKNYNRPSGSVRPPLGNLTNFNFNIQRPEVSSNKLSSSSKQRLPHQQQINFQHNQQQHNQQVIVVHGTTKFQNRNYDPVPITAELLRGTSSVGTGLAQSRNSNNYQTNQQPHYRQQQQQHRTVQNGRTAGGSCPPNLRNGGQQHESLIMNEKVPRKEIMMKITDPTKMHQKRTYDQYAGVSGRIQPPAPTDQYRRTVGNNSDPLQTYQRRHI